MHVHRDGGPSSSRCVLRVSAGASCGARTSSVRIAGRELGGASVKMGGASRVVAYLCAARGPGGRQPLQSRGGPRSRSKMVAG
eukprot:scaffold21_cov368-Prasinococcus_capsulatus_cf.AAC.24